jgi:hypothetical protein
MLAEAVMEQQKRKVWARSSQIGRTKICTSRIPGEKEERRIEAFGSLRGDALNAPTSRLSECDRT